MLCSANFCIFCPVRLTCFQITYIAPKIIFKITSIYLNLAYFCRSCPTILWACINSAFACSNYWVRVLISRTNCCFSWESAYKSFSIFLDLDSVCISLSCIKAFSLRLSSKSLINFCVWLTLSINFFSMFWYCPNLLSNLWKTYFKFWIYRSFSLIIPFILSIYFVKLIYFCL